jgi:hypothetical protein
VSDETDNAARRMNFVLDLFDFLSSLSKRLSPYGRGSLRTANGFRADNGFGAAVTLGVDDDHFFCSFAFRRLSRSRFALTGS